MQQSGQQQVWRLCGDSLSCPSGPGWILALGSSQDLQWNVGMKGRIPLGAQASIWLWSTHLQVKELAVPPVDSLGGGVRPGHVDNIYLQEKEEWVSG